MPWRPSLAELTQPMAQPRSWGISLEPFRKGIDNARVDVLLSPRLRRHAARLVRGLVQEDLAVLVSRAPVQRIGTDDLADFRTLYLGLFESALERCPASEYQDALVLLQFALLKLLLQESARETQALADALKAESETSPEQRARAEAREQLVRLTLEGGAVQRRVLQLVFRQIRILETGHLHKLRSSLVGRHWPIPDTVLFNPLLSIRDPLAERALVLDYPLALIAEVLSRDWMACIESCLVDTLGPYLFAHGSADALADPGTAHAGAGRRDQGDFPGFLGTEILLERCVPVAEFRQGLAFWPDDPANLGLLLGCPDDGDDARGCAQGSATPWQQRDWPEFRRVLRQRLRSGLDSMGLVRAAEGAYTMPALRALLGQPVPLALVLDHADGVRSRRRLAQRLDAQRIALDGTLVMRALDQQLALRRQAPPTPDETVARVLTDYLTLRRDLKLAYKTFEVLNGIHLLEEIDEAQLSRANGSLYEFPGAGESGPQARRVRSHAVIKADVRGSTLMTEELRARGLNPASHFSLSLFNPVNTLLAEFGAEKVFVEGDAVILALFEYRDQPEGLVVARACRLARKVLEVVTLQNVQSRQNGLPELELGLGISFSDREPNFLYDDGRRIMISSAINQADRLSSCSGLLRRSGFEPGHPAYRVSVVRDAVGGERAGPGRDLLTFNVNGVKLDEKAFLKLQSELRLTQVRLPEHEDGESLFMVGRFLDADHLFHWLVLRHAPVHDWHGDDLGPVDSSRRHYFELIVDPALCTRLRRVVSL